ncbi:MAG TPA: alpha/beta fold hydrolase [Gammaproteobacteria bacterium]|nr:alpha/beta fold hydrolase [Gammaproteobacteria bacterium]
MIVIIISATLLAVHIGFRAPRRIERSSPADCGITYEEIHIRTDAGKQLYAWRLPAVEPAPTLIMLHGWGGNAELMLPLALPLHRAGMNILLLDARNHGRSDSASFSSLPRFAEDAGTAVDWVKAHCSDPRQRIALLGHSVGGGAVLFEASRRDDIAAVISIAAFAHPEWMMRRYLDRFMLPDFCIAWILHYIERVIGHSYSEIAPMNTACRIRCPVLLVHGTADETVPVTDAQAIQDHCHGSNPELLLIDGGTHDSVEEVECHGDRLVAFLRKTGVI